MPLVFGLDIGATSVGFAVFDHDSEAATGQIHRLYLPGTARSEGRAVEPGAASGAPSPPARAPELPENTDKVDQVPARYHQGQ